MSILDKVFTFVPRSGNPNTNRRLFRGVYLDRLLDELAAGTLTTRSFRDATYFGLDRDYCFAHGVVSSERSPGALPISCVLEADIAMGLYDYEMVSTPGVPNTFRILDGNVAVTPRVLHIRLLHNGRGQARSIRFFHHGYTGGPLTPEVSLAVRAAVADAVDELTEWAED